MSPSVGHFSVCSNPTTKSSVRNVGDQREPGWWIQQLIKLGAATQIENISPTYVVWDGKLRGTLNFSILFCDRLLSLFWMGFRAVLCVLRNNYCATLISAIYPYTDLEMHSLN